MPKTDKTSGSQREPIAIVGIGCRFPGGANSPDAFWNLLINQVDAIQDVPANRFAVDPIYDPKPGTPGKTCSRWGGFINDIDQFDAAFFGISPREAARMDPQQRLILEVAWDALKDAGQSPQALAGSSTGVFVGVSTVDYENIQLFFDSLDNIDIYALTGGGRHTLAGRLSYMLNVTGPSFALDTACSSSLVAVHLACQSLQSGECSQAIVGAVNLVLIPETTIGFSQAKALSPDGRCQFGDARANGFVRSDGVGVVILKPFTQAQADGDFVYAVIKGTAVNNDGRSSGLLTVPSQQGQEQLLRQAYQDAGVSPGSVQYVEAHGTGTSVGDPIELQALGTVVQEGRVEGDICLVGSVKTNIGHTEAAAGLAGLIKVALSLQHGLIPSTLHLETPNPKVPWGSIPLQIPTEALPWPVDEERPFLAGVSAFGISGTNAHVVLTAPDKPIASPKQSRYVEQPHLFVTSAHTPAALQENIHRYQRFLSAEETAASWPDLCFSSAVRADHYDYRLALVARTKEELLTQLAKQSATGVAVKPARPGKTAFVFPGQGSQWIGMGRTLLAAEPVFAQALTACDEALQTHVDWCLLDLLQNEKALTAVDVIQPAIFAIQVALAALWRSWGIEPDVVIGQSMGEVAAACVSGALTLADAAKIICHRSQLVKTSRSGQGAMAVVGLPRIEAEVFLSGYERQVAVAVSSSPRSTVLSGDVAALDAVLAQIEGQNIFCRRINVDYASHSSHVDHLLPKLAQMLADVVPQQTAVPMISTVTGVLVAGNEMDARYWCDNLRKPVLFAETVRSLLADGYDTFIEISPHPVVLSALQQSAQQAGKETVLLPSLHREMDEKGAMLESLGHLYVKGHNINWEQLYPPTDYHYVKLPAYPWQRESFWTTAQMAAAPRSYYQDASQHPLLSGHLQPAAQSNTHHWEMEIGAKKQPYLQDHRVRQNVTVPTTVFIEMALAAAGKCLDTDEPLVVNDMTLQEVLHLPDDGGNVVQVMVERESSTQATFAIFSQGGDSTWQQHVKGYVSQPTGNSIPVGEPLLTIQDRCPQIVSAQSHYDAMDAVGIQYGPAFQGIQRIWKREGEALAHITLPMAAGQSHAYHIHPALLDACLQVTLSVVPEGSLFLPVGIEQFQLYVPLPQTVWSHITLRPQGDDHKLLIGDLHLRDEAGVVLAQLSGLSIRNIQAKPEQEMSADWLYHLGWQEQKLDIEDATHTAPSCWVLFGNMDGVSGHLQRLLSEKGEQVILVSVGKEYNKLRPDHYQINPGHAPDYDQLLSEITNTHALHGVVHLWGAVAEPKQTTLTELQQAQEITCGTVLYLVQVLAQYTAKQGTVAFHPRLWLITAGTQSVTSDEVVSPASASLWGLGRVIMHEQPVLHCTNIDLSLQVCEAEIESLSRELLTSPAETHLALRGEKRYVGRLQQHVADAGRGSETSKIVDIRETAVSLRIRTPGILENLSPHLVERLQPGPNEVEIEVQATGLNFADVMKALGIYPGITPETTRLGIECAGVVTAVGEHVQNVSVGDEVVAIASQTFGVFAVAPADYVAAKPQQMDFVEAATLPVSYLTAYYALHELGRLRAGERVLIHAASGGVGLAAVQIAQQVGAEVFATAGTLEKRSYLRSIGIQHVMDSRSLAFAHEIRQQTSGEGVDVVLNSLSGAAIEKGLALMRSGGRFLELGKRDIYEDRRLGMALFKKNVAFFAVDLDPDRLFAELRPLISPVFQTMMTRLNAGEWSPLPASTFPLSQAQDAFRYMAQSRHIGKIVLLPRAEPEVKVVIPPSKRVVIQADGSYLITGGFGGLGLAVAQWLANQGARNLILVGRSGAKTAVEPILQQMENQGICILRGQANVACAEQLADIVSQARATMPPLRGVIHAAGVLDDGILPQLNWDRFEQVMAPKIHGTWNLHQLTLGDPLDFFILFSSAAALIGSPGQGNYSAANAFLDAFAHYRRSQGLPALSINWGPWSETGLAARPDRNERLAFRGMKSMTPEQGITAFAQLLSQSTAQVGVMPMDWARWQQFYADAGQLPLFAQFVDGGKGQTDAGHNTVSFDDLAHMDAVSRQGALSGLLSEQFAQVLGLTSTHIDVYKPLINLGMDSLMAVEFKNRLHTSLGVSLPLADLLKGSSITDVTHQLIASYFPTIRHENGSDNREHKSHGHGQADNASQLAALLAQVEQLSDAEVQILLGSSSVN